MNSYKNLQFISFALLTLTLSVISGTNAVAHVKDQGGDGNTGARGGITLTSLRQIKTCLHANAERCKTTSFTNKEYKEIKKNYDAYNWIYGIDQQADQTGSSNSYNSEIALIHQIASSVKHSKNTNTTRI